MVATAIDVLEGRARWSVECGDCLALMRTLPDACIDAVVTDPPAGISFMGAEWDGDKGGRAQWTAWLSSVMAECLRALKPGGHALVWALPRTSHWTGTAIEDAGFEIRDVCSHFFGSGFPKSVDLSKAADKMVGAQRPVVGVAENWGASKLADGKVGLGDFAGKWSITSPATTAAAAAAAALQGWGSALKPAAEFWWLARKPFNGSLVRNVLAHGTGGLNIDACRVGEGGQLKWTAPRGMGYQGGSEASASASASAVGRWPANLVLSHAEGCELVGTRKVKAAPSWNDNRPPSLFTGGTTSPVHHTDGDGTETGKAAKNPCRASLIRLGTGGSGSKRTGRSQPGTRSTIETTTTETTRSTTSSALPANGTTTIISDCENATPLSTASSTGSVSGADASSPLPTSVSEALAPITAIASRVRTPIRTSGAHETQPMQETTNGLDEPLVSHWLYQSKSPTAEKERGLDHRKRRKVTDGRATPIDNAYQRAENTRANTHPTPKSIALMRWLCRLITPAGGLVLDPFTGSGSTGVACSQEGLRFIGLELSEEFSSIARDRIVGDSPLLNREVGT